MKNYFKLGMLFLAVTLFSCGGDGGSDGGAEKPVARPNPNASAPSDSGSSSSAGDVSPSERVDFSTKGVGPISSVDIDLDSPIDQAMADKGKEVYEINCTACHKPYETLVGPPQAGILERRTPEWIMNMVMNPEQMVKEDPLAKEVFLEFNGSPMSDQGITEEEARALLEYFRTL